MNLVLFFQTSKTTRVHKQISDDDNVGCNDNYDGNFYDNYDKNYKKKHTIIVNF